jgi:hypothetical protein
MKPLMAIENLLIRATLNGKRTEAYGHEYHIWDVDKVREIAAKKEDEVTFFCGGLRNFDRVIDLFGKVFVLNLDTETLKQRLDSRTVDDWGGTKKEKELILRLHATKEDIPDGMIIDAARRPDGEPLNGNPRTIGPDAAITRRAALSTSQPPDP